VILAEAGAEFSYGVDVYAFDGVNVKYLGNIGAVVNIHDTLSSSVPYIIIEDDNKILKFTFVKDVMMLNKKGEYVPFSKNNISYVYKGNKLNIVVKKY
jgi:hypothetical protein